MSDINSCPVFQRGVCQGSEDVDKDRETSNSPFKAHMNSSTMEDTVKLIIAYAEDPEVGIGTLANRRIAMEIWVFEHMYCLSS